MLSAREICQLVEGLTGAELDRWVAHRWVCPLEESLSEPSFRDIDVARVRLIYELRHDFEVNDAGLDIVLKLLDQLYAMRRDVSLIENALMSQPVEIREAIAQALSRLKEN